MSIFGISSLSLINIALLVFVTILIVEKIMLIHYGLTTKQSSQEQEASANRLIYFRFSAIPAGLAILILAIVNHALA